MKKRIEVNGIVLISFSVLLMFAMVLCGFFTVLIGARVYENISGRSEAAFAECIPYYYIANKIRQSDEEGMAEISSHGGQRILSLEQLISGEKYGTYIYLLRGHLMEIFTKDIHEVDVADGMIILEACDINFYKEEGRLLRIEGGEGSNCRMFLYPRSEKKTGVIKDEGDKSI